MRPFPKVFLGLGSNVGHREENLGQGLKLLEAGGFTITMRSSIYETEPVGGPLQGPFLNMVVEGRTEKSPEALLALCLETERTLGRVRRERDGPRTLDIDILLWGDLVRVDDLLSIPHPSLHERKFVLLPLAEIAPHGALHPVLGLTAREMLEACGDRHSVVLFEARCGTEA